ncbi:MAG: branched-chain amino acid ABC transporter permease [Kineosporiaceae bacterium]
MTDTPVVPSSRTGAIGEWRARFSAAPGWVKLLVAAAFVALIAALPVIDPPLLTTPESAFVAVLFSVGIYALCAIGLNIVVGMAGLLDLGYVGFFATGAYTVAVFGSPKSELGTGWPWLACVPLAVAVSMLAGVLLGWPTLRLRGDYLAIVTLGFGEIVRLTAVNWGQLGNMAGIAQVPRPPGKRSDGSKLFSIIDVKPFFWLVLAAVLLVLVLVSNLERSRVGRSWLAIREDEDAAELMGVPTFRFKLWAFACGAAVGGLSGAIYASYQQFVNPESFPVQTSMMFLAAVLIGGAGNKYGVVLGAVIVYYTPERLRSLDDSLVITWYVVLVAAAALWVWTNRRPGPAGRARRWWLGPAVTVAVLALLPVLLKELPTWFGDRGKIDQLRFLMFGAALIVMSVFRPQGLLPNRRRATELADRAKEVEAGVNA